LARALGRGERTDRTAGTVVAITPAGHLTARAAGAEFPPEGTAVTDRTGRLRGRVARVFGPVGRPYLAIRLPRPPGPADGAALLGQTLVVEKGK